VIEREFQDSDSTPPMKRLMYRPDPNNPFNTLPVKRASPKKLPGESARQMKKRIKQERREMKDE